MFTERTNQGAKGLNMMRVCARVEIVGQPDGRGAARQRANLMASLRQRKQPPELIQVLDISPGGCGFRSRWPFATGARVWLSLPGLETWAATVAWCEDGRGGLQFESPLHPLVAERFAAT